MTYINVNDANEYFETRLNSSSWDDASDEDKLKSLQTATRLIDRLNFIGDKIDKNQLLEFPRNIIVEDDNDVETVTLVETNDDIETACCEIAYSLLSGIDIGKEIDNIYVRSRSFVQGKVEYDRDYIPEYYLAGIPSAIAWNYLRPYLASTRTLTLTKS